MVEDIHHRVTVQEGKVAAIAADVMSFGKELHGIREGQTVLFSKIDQMTMSLATLNASKPAPTLEVMRAVFSMATSAAVILSAIVAGIVYVSSNANNGLLTQMQADLKAIASQASPAEVAVMKQKIDVLERDLSNVKQAAPWIPEIKTSSR